MGTNFYKKKILNIDEVKKLHDKLDNIISNRNYDVYDEFVNEVDKLYHGIHIGKSSIGWQFCFDHNWGKYYDLNKDSFLKWLNDPNSYIEDEYGDKYTYEEFMEYVKGHNENPDNTWTAKTYDEYKRQCDPRYKIYNDYGMKNEFFEKFGFRPEDNDVNVDGLRFAIFSDFS